MSSTTIALHFLKRDIQDTMISWLVFVIVFVIGFLTIPPAIKNGFIIDDSVSAAGACIFFGMVYASQIHGQGAWTSQALPREYLMALPINRKKMFRLGFVRASLGFVPLFLWGLCNHGWVVHIFSAARVPVLRDNPAASVAAFCVLFAVFLLVSHVILTGSSELNSLMKVSGRGRRFTLITKGVARMFAHALAGVIIPYALLNLLAKHPSPFAMISLPICVAWMAYHLHRAERAWLTG